MAAISLWKGYHSPSLVDRLRTAWEGDRLMIFLPVLLNDFSFVSQLPEGDIECLGTWTEDEKAIVARTPRTPRTYPRPPVLGLFSSGSAGGLPKLILYSKDNVEFALMGVMRFFDTDRIDHVFCYPHPFHTFGLLLGYVLAVLNKWRFTALDGKYNSHFHEQWLTEVGPGTLTLGTPTHYKDLMHFVAARNETPRASYACIAGGAPVGPQLWQSLRDHLKIENPSVGYGATEASPALTHLPPGRKPESAGDIGFALEGVEIRMLPGAGFEFKGPNVCLAILQDGTITFPEKILLKDDLQKNADGSYSFLGRTDFTLNRGGEKFKLEDIENHLFETFKLNATALAVPDTRLGFDLALLIDSTCAAAIHREDMLKALHQKYRVLFNKALFQRTPHFPLNESGKRDRARAAIEWRALYDNSQKIYGTP